MYKQVMSMGGQVMQAQTFDGEKGKSLAMGTSKMMEGAELEKMKYQAIMNVETQYEKLGYKFDLKGIEAIDGSDAYKIKATLPDGSTTTEYYNVESGLKVREVSTQDAGPMGSVTVTMNYSDYKEVDGIMLPHTMKQSMGPQSFSIKLEEYKANTSISDDEFKVE